MEKQEWLVTTKWSRDQQSGSPQNYR